MQNAKFSTKLSHHIFSTKFDGETKKPLQILHHSPIAQSRLHCETVEQRLADSGFFLVNFHTRAKENFLYCHNNIFACQFPSFVSTEHILRQFCKALRFQSLSQARGPDLYSSCCIV